MAFIRRSIAALLFLAYFIAIHLKSDFWGNILSPIVTLLTCYVVFRAFFYDSKPRSKNVPGLLLAVGIFVWALSDILWAVLSIGFHIDPEEVMVITLGYILTNVLFVISLSMYGFRECRKWNLVQVLLDTIVEVFFVVYVVWIFFLDQRIENLVELQTDYLSHFAILLDIIVIIWIVIWYMSFRNGKLPLHMRFVSAAVLIFSLTDLVYYYQYFFEEYDPNTLLDSIYVVSFGLLALAGTLKHALPKEEVSSEVFNIGRKSKGLYLLTVPLVVIIFKGFLVVMLFQFMLVILFYTMLSNYIQNNIRKNELLAKELELNSKLEHMVKERTEELTEKNKILEEMINHDLITGLWNKRYLLPYLDKEIQQRLEEETIALFYIDINRYKMISTMFGHYIGEGILIGVAERLTSLMKEIPNSVLTSYGEDMFVVVIKGEYDMNDRQLLANKIIMTTSDIYRLEEYQIRITVNVGISIYPGDAISKEELIKHADIAMSHARSFGFNAIQEYDFLLSNNFYRRNSIEIMLKKVNFDQEFMIYYQPQLSADQRRLIGFEALIRWRTPKGEFIPPMEFIPIAEETGYIVTIGDWVMKKALRQLAEWNRVADEKLTIGINISLKQLNTVQFTESLYEEIRQLRLQPEWIDIEITESIQLQDNAEMISILEEIRQKGITVSIDDFGTGFSSLSYFRNLPIDRIKLARELVQSVHIDKFDYQLIKSIIQISRAKGVRVIAEGVETEEQWATLKELGCDEVQGYLFGIPMPVAEVEATYNELLH
ncbi:MAG: diguanylate cyclase [Herbinix sp.]|jgi:diguanylate cyclase (GGDEF)-like protein|nr:diguanylate cyclase [Herbinix sp.]